MATRGNLRELRQSLPESQRKIVQEVMAHIESELIDAFPELNMGVQTATASGSFSATLQIKGGKRGRFVGKVSARVRTPREPFEIDMHIDDDEQLSLGLPTNWNEGEGEGGEGGEE